MNYIDLFRASNTCAVHEREKIEWEKLTYD